MLCCRKMIFQQLINVNALFAPGRRPKAASRLHATQAFSQLHCAPLSGLQHAWSSTTH
jgi:hypothetical protein